MQHPLIVTHKMKENSKAHKRFNLEQRTIRDKVLHMQFIKLIRSNKMTKMIKDGGENHGACEKCWGDAYIRARTLGGFQVDRYYELLDERKDNPCSVQEQKGTLKWEATEDDLFDLI